MKTTTVLGAVGFLALVACSAAPDGGSSSSGSSASKHYDPPAGCSRTACDADADKCRSSAQASCSSCRSDCAVIDIDFQLQCDETCDRICNSADDRAQKCDATLSECKATSPRNGFCADGISNQCVPSSSYSMKLPDTAGHAGVCSDADVDDFINACLIASSTQSKCSSFTSAHRSCVECALGTTGSEPLWEPSKDAKSMWTNDGLCVALRGEPDCGRAIFAADSCAANACASCTADVSQCAQGAYAVSCADAKAKKDACVANLPADVRADCVTPEDGSADFVPYAKRGIAQACGK